MLVDVVTLAGIYSLRIGAGAVAAGVMLSEWLIVSSLFVFTSLALIKRFGVLSMREAQGSLIPPTATTASPICRDHRRDRSRERHERRDGVRALRLVLAVTPLYSRPWMLWLLAPCCCTWFGRALMIAHRREMPTIPSSTPSGTARAASPWRQ